MVDKTIRPSVYLMVGTIRPKRISDGRIYPGAGRVELCKGGRCPRRCVVGTGISKGVNSMRNPMARLSVYKTLEVLTIALLLSIPAAVQGQTSSIGAISGTVTDSTGAVIPAATVVVTNQATGVSRTLTTDTSGFYSAESLASGLYTIAVSKPGFQGNTTRGIQLDPGQRRANNLTLAVGQASAQVEVLATASTVNTETSESGGTVTGEQVSNLMLNGRDFQTLAIMVPGVSSTNYADNLSGTTTTLIINGTSSEYSTYTVDGIYNMNSGSLAQINIVPIVDGISEFRVLNDNYSAKYGFAGSGQIVVNTKSGTENFNGTAWEFLRNNAFDANNYFSPTSQGLHQNIFGYTLGGPLIIPKIYNTDRSKKTFFFASNQWYKNDTTQVLRGTMLTAPMRAGNFNALPGGGAANLSFQDARSPQLLASEGKTNCILSPTMLNPSCLDPTAVAVVNAFEPQPNSPGGGFLNYVNTGPLLYNEIDYQYRVDHSINQNNQLTFRVMYADEKFNYPYDNWGDDIGDLIKDDNNYSASNLLARWTSDITPNLVNTLSIAQTEDKTQYITNSAAPATLPSGATIAQSFPGADPLNRVPNINFSAGYSQIGVGSEPITASDGEGIAGDDASWVKHNHVLQFGALYMFGIKRQTVFTEPQGSFTFTGVHTGNAAADYMLGLNSTYSQASTQRHAILHYRQAETYFQDDWKATRRLTLNLGLRWVYFSNDTASGDEVTSFSPAAYNPAAAPVVNINGSLQVNSANQPVTSAGVPANLLNGLLFAGQNGVPSGFFIPTKKNFGPRVGFAYDLSGDGKTSIRGGYGIGYSRIPVEQIYNAFGQNPPYNVNSNILNSLLSNATAGTTTPTPQTLNNVPLNFVPSQIQSFSLTVEHQIVPNMIATAAYVGSLGRHLMTFQGGYDQNEPLPVSAPSTSGCLAPLQAPSSSYNYDPCISTGASSPNYTVPYKGYGTMDGQYDEGSSNYNALQTGVTYRAGGQQFNLAYTYQKTLGTIGNHVAGRANSETTQAQDSRNFAAEYGPPSYDFRQDVTGTWVYDIPFFKHNDSRMTRGVLGNWSFAGLGLFQSGFALSPGLSTSTAGLAIRPNQVTPYQRIGKLAEWFNTASFVAPGYGFYGNASNGSIRGPDYTSFNTALYKAFPITERLSAQFRAEAFNVANHPNFENVSTGLGSGSYGQLTSAGDPRILEFALKVMY
jgi:hypothetical protein